MTLTLGLLSLLLAVVSYSLYLKDIFKGHTKPHGFSWLIWAILNSSIFYQQITHHSGPGGWVTGAAALANILIFLTSFKYGERSITRFDWFCLGLALSTLLLWLLNMNTELSVILVCIVFVIGLIPTFRKSLRNAHEETATTFALNGLKFFIALFALESVSITTALYPLVLVVVNASFAAFLVYRQIRSSPGVQNVSTGPTSRGS